MKKLIVLSIVLTIFFIMTTFTAAIGVEEHPEILSVTNTSIL
ncbi:hypothetical protein [Chengkuizengella sediminis]|nr:hypothetical protein [Chengkuizengella sediminis]